MINNVTYERYDIMIIYEVKNRALNLHKIQYFFALLQ